jgi:hypothetical protein
MVGGHLGAEMRNTDNDPYDPCVGCDADCDFLPLIKF